MKYGSTNIRTSGSLKAKYTEMKDDHRFSSTDKKDEKWHINTFISDQIIKGFMFDFSGM